MLVIVKDWDRKQCAMVIIIFLFSVHTLAGGKVRLSLERILRLFLQKVEVLVGIGSNSVVYKGDFTKRLIMLLVRIT